MDDTSLKILTECRFSPFFFMKLTINGQKSLLNWCMSVGLIAPTYECPNCAQNMTLSIGKKSIHIYEWRCSKQHEENPHLVSRSIIEGSCFSYISLSIYETLYFMWLCVSGNIEIVEDDDDLDIDDETIADCYMFCREIFMIDLINNSDKIGGENVIVEIDICKLGEMKYGRDKLPNGYWVFGGFERRTTKSFFKIVENNTKLEFLKIISEWVVPGSVIMSDCLKLYDCHMDEDFIHLCTVNNLTFKDSVMSELNKSIEAARPTFEGPLRYDIDVKFDSYLAEHIWRKKHDSLSSSDKFKLFLKAIIKSYHPLCKDNQS